MGVAIGSCLLFNINIQQNFKSPLFSSSATEFWRRWHISLSSWLRDYLFAPLQMKFRNRGINGIALALLITFSISGLWHGATIGFILWGIYHGVWLALEVYASHIAKKFQINIECGWLCRGIKILITFILFSISLVLFRVDGIQNALIVIKKFMSSIKNLLLSPPSFLEETFINVSSVIQIEFSKTWSLNLLILLTSAFIIFFYRAFYMYIKDSNPYLKFALIEFLMIYSLIFGTNLGGGFAYFKF